MTSETMSDVNLIQTAKSIEDYFYHKFGIIFLVLNLLALAIQLAEENKWFVTYESNFIYVYFYSHFGFLLASIIWFIFGVIMEIMTYLVIIVTPEDKLKKSIIFRYLLKKTSRAKLFFYVQFILFIVQMALILNNTILFSLTFGY